MSFCRHASLSCMYYRVRLNALFFCLCAKQNIDLDKGSMFTFIYSCLR